LTLRGLGSISTANRIIGTFDVEYDVAAAIHDEIAPASLIPSSRLPTLYRPLEPFFDKSWRPSVRELVHLRRKTQNDAVHVRFWPIVLNKSR
jgi:hypothetical protein